MPTGSIGTPNPLAEGHDGPERKLSVCILNEGDCTTACPNISTDDSGP